MNPILTRNKKDFKTLCRQLVSNGGGVLTGLLLLMVSAELGRLYSALHGPMEAEAVAAALSLPGAPHVAPGTGGGGGGSGCCDRLDD